MHTGLYPDPCTAQAPATAPCLVIVGLPASGKTSYARSLLGGRSHYEDVHHWLFYREQHIQVGDDRFGRFLSDLRAGRPWVIDSVEMCEREVRERFVNEYLGSRNHVEWLFFENEPEQCMRNAHALEHRGEGHREHRLREIERVTRVYDIPPGAIRRQVYRPLSGTTWPRTGNDLEAEAPHQLFHWRPRTLGSLAQDHPNQFSAARWQRP